MKCENNFPLFSFLRCITGSIYFAFALECETEKNKGREKCETKNEEIFAFTFVLSHLRNSFVNMCFVRMQPKIDCVSKFMFILYKKCVL